MGITTWEREDIPSPKKPQNHVFVRVIRTPTRKKRTMVKVVVKSAKA